MLNYTKFRSKSVLWSEKRLNSAKIWGFRAIGSGISCFLKVGRVLRLYEGHIAQPDHQKNLGQEYKDNGNAFA